MKIKYCRIVRVCFACEQKFYPDEQTGLTKIEGAYVFHFCETCSDKKYHFHVKEEDIAKAIPCAEMLINPNVL